MKRIIYCILGLMALTTLNSCEKQLMTYEGKPGIYFNETARLQKFQGEVLTDSVALSFALLASNEIIQPIIVAATGNPATEDREYKLVIDPVSTAISGTHYDGLPKTFTMKKNKFIDTIFIKFKRTPDLLVKGVTLFLNLEANENFVAELKDKVTSASTGKKISFIKYRVFLSDILKKPTRWLDGSFGTFTRKKLFLMCEFLNITPGFIDASISIAESSAYGKLMQRYLIDEKLAGRTVYEDDGQEMSMGPDSQ